MCQCVSYQLVAAAKSRGAADLDCPVDHVRAYRATDGGYVARGCGYWAEYDCVTSGRGTWDPQTACVARARPEVHEDAWRPDPE
jgi:hypothetical protein